MSTETVTDIAALVGEMEAPACEHSQHGEPHPFHSEGPATHYIRAIHPCEPISDVYAVCQAMVNAVLSGALVRCSCGGVATTNETHEVVGPVSK